MFDQKFTSGGIVKEHKLTKQLLPGEYLIPISRLPKIKILALDLGTNTGWAMKTDSSIISGSVNFATKRNEGGGMRFLRFRRWLDSISTGIAEIHFEEVRRHAGTQAAHVYGGLMGTLTAWCEEHSIPYSSVPVGVIKKSATGKGNASKEQMIEAAKRKGFNPADDNEADALALLHFVM